MRGSALTVGTITISSRADKQARRPQNCAQRAVGMPGGSAWRSFATTSRVGPAFKNIAPSCPRLVDRLDTEPARGKKVPTRRERAPDQRLYGNRVADSFKRAEGAILRSGIALDSDEGQAKGAIAREYKLIGLGFDVLMLKAVATKAVGWCRYASTQAGLPSGAAGQAGTIPTLARSDETKPRRAFED